jgi:Fic family protein
MEHAVIVGASAKSLRVLDVLEIQRVLMLATTTPQIAGKLREHQNWIGGNAYHPGRADFVPPAPERVKDLMRDLVAFINREDLPPVVQAAIVHAPLDSE